MDSPRVALYNTALVYVKYKGIYHRSCSRLRCVVLIQTNALPLQTEFIAYNYVTIIKKKIRISHPFVISYLAAIHTAMKCKNK